MSINAYLHRLCRRAKPAAKPRPARPRLGLENLEDRLALSTVTISGTAPNRVLTYDAGTGIANDLTISRAGSTYTFAEKGEAIVVGGSFFSSVTADRSTFDRIQVNLKDGADALKVQSTDRPISVDAGSGNDVVTVGNATNGMDDILALVNVNGGAQDVGGKDTLSLLDQAAINTFALVTIGGKPVLLPTKLSYGVGANSISRQRLDALGAPATPSRLVTSIDVEDRSLETSERADVISVSANPAGKSLEVFANGGDDAITAGNNLDLLAGTISLDGGPGANSLTANDRAAAAGHKYVVNTDSVKEGRTEIDFVAMNKLAILAPDRVNDFDVQSASIDMPLTLTGGSQIDNATINDGAFTIGQSYAFDVGKLTRSTPFGSTLLPTALVNYRAIDRLVVHAGSGADTFKMSDTAQPPLILDGGAGSDKIDYSTFASNVTVNLATGKATKVAGLSAVENATGGSGNDILVGDANDNVLVGNAGNDVMIGGKGADVIRGGAGEDLMIAADTAFDLDPTALQTILGAWTDPKVKTTQDRVNNLKIGVVGTGGTIQLSDSTVHVSGTADDGAVDTLFGDDDGGSTNATDWFWANAAQDVLTMPSGDIFK